MIKAKQLDFSLLNLLIDFVKDQNFLPFVPGKMDDATSKAIFERDIYWLKQSNIIIADVNEPSHGVGMEIMYAYIYDIPVIGLIDKKNRPLSRMVEGGPHVVLIEYVSKEDLMDKLSKYQLEELQVKLCNNCNEKTIHKKNLCLKC